MCVQLACVTTTVAEVRINLRTCNLLLFGGRRNPSKEYIYPPISQAFFPGIMQSVITRAGLEQKEKCLVGAFGGLSQIGVPHVLTSCYRGPLICFTLSERL